MGFAENLKHLMETNNVSNYLLAKKLGVSQTSVANWLSGGNVPHKKTMVSVASLFGLSVDEMIGEEKPNAKLEKKESPTPGGAGLTDAQKSAMELIRKMDDATLERFVAAAKAMLSLD